jgi:hypothetical protein
MKVAHLLMATWAGLIMAGCADNASTNATPPGDRAGTTGTTGNSATTTTGGTATGNTAGGTAADPHSQQSTGTGATTTTGGTAGTSGH